MCYIIIYEKKFPFLQRNIIIRRDYRGGVARP